MKVLVVPLPANTSRKTGGTHQTNFSDVSLPGEVAMLLAGLERQKEELGPIADELIDLLRHIGVGKPPPQKINPSSE